MVSDLLKLSALSMLIACLVGTALGFLVKLIVQQDKSEKTITKALANYRRAVQDYRDGKVVQVNDLGKRVARATGAKGSS